MRSIEKPNVAVEGKSVRRIKCELLGPHAVRGNNDAFAVPGSGPRDPNSGQVSANRPQILFILQLKTAMPGGWLDLSYGDEEVEPFVVDRKGDVDARVRSVKDQDPIGHAATSGKN